MFSKLREPFGTAGLIVAIVALVFALGGGAWALTASTSGKHKHSLKAKGHARGTRGPQGPAGPEGPEGPAGANGKNGTNGKAGTDGTNGTPGKSVVSGQEPAGGNCAEGGYWFELQGTGNKQYVCNGGGGSGGGGGGTAGGTTLAPGDTMVGLWSFNQTAALGKLFVDISFPLQFEPDKALWGIGTPFFEYLPLEAPSSANCPGSYGNPLAAPGHVCMYTAGRFNAVASEPHNELPSSAGVLMTFVPEDPNEPSVGLGSWAATAALPTP